jgi:cytochrome c553
MVSHPDFTPTFKVLSRKFRGAWCESTSAMKMAVFGSISPRGPHAADPMVQSGYPIARQSCWRCHNMGPNGGWKSGHPWLVLSAWATASPDYFNAYVRDPRSRNPRAQTPSNPGYDDATLRALADYFRRFSSGNATQEE